MPVLTRRRSPDAPHIHYGDERVGVFLTAKTRFSLACAASHKL
jgi:hypothetical protein